MAKLRQCSFIGKRHHLLLAILVLPVALLLNIFAVLFLLLNPRSWKFNKVEAAEILEKELAPFMSMPYDECKKSVESAPVLNKTILASSGCEYQVEVQMMWDRSLDGPIRVLGSIDDGRLRAYIPLTKSFVVTKKAQ